MKLKESFLIILITMFVFWKQKNWKWQCLQKKKCPRKIKKNASTQSRKFVNGIDKRFLLWKNALIQKEDVNGENGTKRLHHFDLHLIPFQLKQL